jgi:hypothetical protein
MWGYNISLASDAFWVTQTQSNLLWVYTLLNSACVDRNLTEQSAERRMKRAFTRSIESFHRPEIGWDWLGPCSSTLLCGGALNLQDVCVCWSIFISFCIFTSLFFCMYIAFYHNSERINSILGCAIAKAVRRRLFTAEAGQSMWDLWWTKWHWDKLLSELFSFPLSVSFHRCSIFTHVSCGRWTVGPLAAAVT